MNIALGIDVNIRYLPIVRELKARFGDALAEQSILEVGSGDQGIARYLNLPVTGIDVAFGTTLHPKLKPIKHQGYLLPFESQSFDVVVSTDMLEHVPPEHRFLSVSEMARVARKMLCLAVPAGKLAEAQDKALDELYYKLRGEHYPFLKEHVENGLPTVETINQMLAKVTEHRTATIRHFKNYNLAIRMIEMRAFITPALWAKAVFRFLHVFSLAPSLLSFGNCYREIFIVNFDNRAER